MMRFYISASMQDVNKVKEVADELEKAGHSITFKWWLYHDNSQLVDKLIQGIKDCDTFILVNSPAYTGGKYIESGIAVAENKKLIVMGREITSVFQNKFKQFDWAEFVAYIKLVI